MPNYVQLVGEYYPTTQCYSTGDPTVYADIIWITTAITQSDLDDISLVQYKSERIVALGEDATETVVNGFSSSGLGDLHYYDSQLEDQINLIGVVATGGQSEYSVRETIAGPRIFKTHSAQQLKAVLNDGKDIKLTSLKKFRDLQTLVLLATTEAEVDAIVW